MNTHADKTQENKSQSVSNGESRIQSGGESTFQFENNRPEAVAQRKLQELANNSPQNKQAAQLQAMADNFSSKQHPIQKKENNTGLPDNLKSGLENLSGYSMDDVKVHHNSDKPAQLQAHAYAQGSEIHLGSGQEKHLPHEAWHVVQQKQGRVKPTMQMKGNMNVNDDAGLEKEADVMGAKALSLSMASQTSKLADGRLIDSPNKSVLQCQKGSLSQDTNGLQKGTKVEFLKKLGRRFSVRVVSTGKKYWIEGETKDFFKEDDSEVVVDKVVEDSSSEAEYKEKPIVVLEKQPQPKQILDDSEEEEKTPEDSFEQKSPLKSKEEASGKEEVDTENGFLIPDTLSLENLIRGDNREHHQLASDGFKPGKTVEGYFDKLKAFLDGMNDKKKSESTAQIMKDRIPGKAILNPKDKLHQQIDLVWSREKIEITGGRKITLLNYVCTGMASGAGGNDYLINVNESFECISASPSIGLYQSASGLQILAMGLSASPAKGEYVKFHEYDFITSIPPEIIYYNSKDGGKTQSIQDGEWYNIVTGKPL
jgi:hypothetical protein